jgi:hypothetical protein
MINGELTLRIFTEISSYPDEFFDLSDLMILERHCIMDVNLMIRA